MDNTHQDNFFEGGMPLLSDDEKFGIGTTIRTFNIIKIGTAPDGHEVILNLDLDSGYSLENAVLKITNEDLRGYETADVHQAVKFALGFFDEE